MSVTSETLKLLKKKEEPKTPIGDQMYLPNHSGLQKNSRLNISVPDEAYSVSWNGSLEVPTKNSVYDKIETLYSLADNVSLYFGTGNDVSIKYTGTVWDFDILAATSEIVFNNSGFDTDFRIESDSNANLFFLDAGNNKIVIGSNSSPGTTSFNVSDTSGVIGLQATASNNWSGFNLYNHSGTLVGSLVYGNSGASAFTNQMVFSTRASTTDLIFYTVGSGGQSDYKEHLRCVSSGASTVINEQGLDMDFRVEGDTNANLIFADAGLDKVGIGKSSPVEVLDVNGNINIPSASAYMVNQVAGVSGSFTTVDGKTVTVTKGIITSIV